MAWLILAIAAPFFWAISNLIDSYLVRVRIKDPLVILCFVGIMSLIPALGFLLLGRPFGPMSPTVVLFSFFTGIIGLLAYYPYLLVLQTEHPATAVLFWNMSPMLVAVASIIFLGERFDIPQIVAIVSLIGSAIFASSAVRSSRTSGRSRRTASSILLMFFASMMTATEATLLKWMFGVAATGAVLFFTFSSAAIFAFVLLGISRRIRHRFLAVLKASSWVFVFFNELLNQGGLVVTGLAISLGSVSLTKSVDGLQPLMVIAIGAVFAKMFRHRRFVMPKAPKTWGVLIATVFAVVGLMLIRS